MFLIEAGKCVLPVINSRYVYNLFHFPVEMLVILIVGCSRLDLCHGFFFAVGFDFVINQRFPRFSRGDKVLRHDLYRTKSEAPEFASPVPRAFVSFACCYSGSLYVKSDVVPLRIYSIISTLPGICLLLKRER